MTINGRSLQCPVVLLMACASFLVSTGMLHAADVMWGNMKANKILFLGNSITLHGPYIEWLPDAHWGMAASEESKDYVHLLGKKIEEKTSASLAIACPDPLPGRWYHGDPLPGYVGNVLNIADIFERNYNTWDNARIQNQLVARPDIVVLQFGENLAGGTLEQFTAALDSLLTGLKNSSNPHIFITSGILGSDPAIDTIKQQACAADPGHRVFVNLAGRVDCSGVASHPSDKGMQTIADILFAAMKAHSVL